MSRFSSHRMANLAALYTLAVMLPFVHFYTYQTTVGRLPFVSGVIPVLTLVGFLPLLWFSARSTLPPSRIGVSAFFLLLYLMVHVLVMHSGGSIIGRDVDGELFSNNMLIIYKALIFLLVGINLRDPFVFRSLVLAVWGVLSVSAFANIGAGSLFLDLDDAAEGMAGLYLFLGDSYAIWALLAVLCARGFPLKLALIAVSLLSLFILTSRTSLYAFIVAEVCVLGVILAREPRLLFHRLLLILFVLVGGAILLLSVVGVDEILQGRMFRLFSEGQDDSWSFRQWQLDMGIEHIKESPIFGNYGSQVLLLGRMGDYIHSYLEVWRQFGIVPFLWIVFLAGAALLMAYRSAAREGTDRDLFVLSIAIFTCLEISTARSWGNSYIFIAIGMCSGALFSSSRRKVHLLSKRSLGGGL